jgi:hypothetical protein
MGGENTSAMCVSTDNNEYAFRIFTYGTRSRGADTQVPAEAFCTTAFALKTQKTLDIVKNGLY